MSIVSIIIPAYNAGEFLSRCLDSVLHQTFRDIEIIIINDASTDNTLEIAERYQQSDSRIKIIDFKENKGNGIGRNTAVKQANGKYILFVDADDRIELELVEKTVTKADSSSYEIVVFGFKEYYPYKRKNKQEVVHLPNISDDENSEKIIQNFLMRQNGILIQPWLYLFKRDFLLSNTIAFSESGAYFEDNIFTARAMVNVSKLAVIPEVLYHYYRHKKSITHSFGIRTVEGRVIATIDVKNILNEYNILKKYENEYSYFFITSGFLSPIIDYLKMGKDDESIEKYFYTLFNTDFIKNFDIYSLTLPPDKNVMKGGFSYKQIQMLTSVCRNHFKSVKFMYRLIKKFGLVPF